MLYNCDFLFSEVKVLSKCGHPKKTIDELAFPQQLPDNATEYVKKSYYLNMKQRLAYIRTKMSQEGIAPEEIEAKINQ